MISKYFTLSLAAFFLAFSSLTQNPFNEIGKSDEVKIVTLSNGRYVEFFENDTLRQIGSVIFNTVTNDIEYIIPEDDLEKIRIAKRDKEVSRFMAVDPLAPKYPYYTPYQFSGNRVIDAIELEGLELKTVKVHISGFADGATTIEKADVIYLNQHFKTKATVILNGSIVDVAKTQVIYSYEGEEKTYLHEFHEPIDYGLLDPNFEGLKPSAKYDYSSSEDMGLKFQEDWEFILNGKGKLSKLQKIIAIQDRDALAVDAEYQNQGLNDIFEAGGYIYFRRYKVKKTDFHPSGGGGIKDRILKDAGGPKSFEYKVGRNPDVRVVDGDKIQLVGTGDKFKGKIFTTELRGKDYFE